MMNFVSSNCNRSSLFAMSAFLRRRAIRSGSSLIIRSASSKITLQLYLILLLYCRQHDLRAAVANSGGRDAEKQYPRPETIGKASHGVVCTVVE